MSSKFVDREIDLAAIDDVVAQGESAIVVLCGPGGVGKSALARRWAHGAKGRFDGGQLYADLQGFSDDEPLDPGQALTAFLRALGVSAQRIPPSLAEQAALYRTVTAERPLLVVLDDAGSAAQVRPLVPASASTVLVTSRRRLTGLLPDGATLLDVGPLPSATSVALLTRTVGRHRIAEESDAAEQLVRICGGLPIALTLVAGRLAARPRLSVGRLATELLDETQRLTRLSAADASVRSVFDSSYRSLSTGAAALYRTLALHPGTDFSLALLRGLSTPARFDGVDAEELLGELLEASLLEEVAEDRFRFHDLLRLHARALAETTDEVEYRQAAVYAMLEFYLAAAHRADLVVTPYRRRLPYVDRQSLGDVPTPATRAQALTWLESERVNLLAAGRTAFAFGAHELAWHLSDVMWPLLLHAKLYRDRLEIDERGVKAARAWGNVWAEADMLKRLSRVCDRLGDREAAQRHGRAAADRYRDAGDVQGELDAEEGLATLHLEDGRHQQATETYRRVLAGRRELSDQRSTALTLLNLGSALIKAGRPGEALEVLAEARRHLATLDRVDPYNGARVLIALADAYLGLGDLDLAEQNAAAAVERMTDLGSLHERAEALDLLGRIALVRGDVVVARKNLSAAAAVFESLGSPRLGSVTRRIDELGEVSGQ
ncbi:tetratricopeptide repeat protein [Micromonospora sp. SH-82]|uniref:tetratricopeptide repeat protein n=1 Tax=Micromonospora sp. SH-82 TaxID=3132938 RepID=UPI003EBB52C1